MKRNSLFRIFTVFLVCMLVLTGTPSAYAQNNDNASSIVFGNGYIRESITVDNSISVVRYTYENNTYITTITEDGISTIIHGEIDYSALFHSLSNEDCISTYDRLSGYTYSYMKTETFTEYRMPEYGTYADILEWVSEALAPYNIKLAAATYIASLIFENSASTYETKITTTATWYIVTETVSGEFISYYVECLANTYVKNFEGNWVYLGNETWDYETLWI